MENKPGKQSRAGLMRRLHAFASAAWGIENPHPLLHQLAVAEFQVESMSHLSDKELVLLYEKVSVRNIDWQKVESLGVTRVPEMSIKQQWLVKKLQKELGWSDTYMDELTINRYGYLDWKYLTGREAWAFVNYLIARRKSKGKKVAA